MYSYSVNPREESPNLHKGLLTNRQTIPYLDHFDILARAHRYHPQS